MWSSDDQCRKVVLEALQDIDLLKVTSAELAFLVGSEPESNSKSDSVAADVAFRQRHAVPVLVLTQGSLGSVVCTSGGTKHVAPFTVKLVEAAGAGDALVAAVLASLLPKLDSTRERREQLKEMSLDDVASAVKRGNAAGAVVCSRLGALCAMPSKEEIDALIATDKTTVGAK